MGPHVQRASFTSIKFLKDFNFCDTGNHAPETTYMSASTCKKMKNRGVKKVENSLKLRNLSKTRWIARAESIRAVWMSYDAVKDTLAAIKTSS